MSAHCSTICCSQSGRISLPSTVAFSVRIRQRPHATHGQQARAHQPQHFASNTHSRIPHPQTPHAPPPTPSTVPESPQKADTSAYTARTSAAPQPWRAGARPPRARRSRTLSSRCSPRRWRRARRRPGRAPRGSRVRSRWRRRGSLWLCGVRARRARACVAGRRRLGRRRCSFLRGERREGEIRVIRTGLGGCMECSTHRRRRLLYVACRGDLCCGSKKLERFQDDEVQVVGMVKGTEQVSGHRIIFEQLLLHPDWRR